MTNTDFKWRGLPLGKNLLKEILFFYSVCENGCLSCTGPTCTTTGKTPKHQTLTCAMRFYAKCCQRSSWYLQRL